jgi:hypothetical protein
MLPISLSVLHEHETALPNTGGVPRPTFLTTLSILLVGASLKLIKIFGTSKFALRLSRYSPKNKTNGRYNLNVANLSLFLLTYRNSRSYLQRSFFSSRLQTSSEYLHIIKILIENWTIF